MTRARMHRALRTCALSIFLVTSLAAVGCSYAAMHGYTVVRSDEAVRYRAGHYRLLPVQSMASGLEHPVSIADGVGAELATRAPEFVASSEGAFAVRVVVEDLTESRAHDGEAPRTNVAARIEILDRDGNVTTELASEHSVEGTGNAASAQVGRELGARLAHYLRERERLYHW